MYSQLVTAYFLIISIILGQMEVLFFWISKQFTIHIKLNYNSITATEVPSPVTLDVFRLLHCLFSLVWGISLSFWFAFPQNSQHFICLLTIHLYVFLEEMSIQFSALYWYYMFYTDPLLSKIMSLSCFVILTNVIVIRCQLRSFILLK